MVESKSKTITINKTKVSTGKLTLAVAIENAPFEDVFPIEKWGTFQPAMLVYQRISTGDEFASLRSWWSETS